VRLDTVNFVPRIESKQHIQYNTDRTDNMVEKTNANQPAGYNCYNLYQFTIWVEIKQNHIKHNPNCIRAGRKSYVNETETVDHQSYHIHYNQFESEH
jgi:hypothetical protein